MPNTRHALAVDMPEYKALIHEMKTTDAHFARLLESYESLSHEIEAMESGTRPSTEDYEHALKSKRVHLKDELLGILKKHGAPCGCGDCACH